MPVKSDSRHHWNWNKGIYRLGWVVSGEWWTWLVDKFWQYSWFWVLNFEFWIINLTIISIFHSLFKLFATLTVAPSRLNSPLRLFTLSSLHLFSSSAQNFKPSNCQIVILSWHTPEINLQSGNNDQVNN
jgi:hypothetical protein